MVKADTDKKLFEVSDLKLCYRLKGSMFSAARELVALEGVNFSVNEGESLAIVGESGCGKSTLKKVLVKLLDATSGTVYWKGSDISTWSAKQLKEWRKSVQAVFQDPYGALNPRMTIGTIVEDPLISLMPELSKKERRTRVLGALEVVGISPTMINRYPHELSGGQAQRIGIARAIVCEPACLVCDEPVSALDVAIQAQILNLLYDLKEKMNLTMIFITHDLGVVRQIADRILVMYLGKLVEIADNDGIFEHCKHPYTSALLSSAPIMDPVLARERVYQPVKGEAPSPINKPMGCAFCTRCPRVLDKCLTENPSLEEISEGRSLACFNPL